VLQTVFPPSTGVPPTTFSPPATVAVPSTLAAATTASVGKTEAPPATVSPLATVPLGSTIAPPETVSPPATQSPLPIASTEDIESIVVTEQDPYLPSASPSASIGPHFATDVPRTTIEVSSGQIPPSTYWPVETRTTAPPSTAISTTTRNFSTTITQSLSMSSTASAPNLPTPTGSHVVHESERSEISDLSNDPNAAEKAESENTPLLVVSVILILVMIVVFVLLIYKEHGHNKLLRQIEEKKEREAEKAVQPKN
jgi:hypothetical protein